MNGQPLGSRYLLDEQIGQGGMGVVWRGHDRVSGDVCAIKLLRPELAADPEAVARFVRERTALIRFRHPNVVTLRDMIVEGDALALVMDFVDGGDLSSYRLRCGGTLPPADAAGITASICDALAAAHAAGIVHRDLKPGNVLLDAGRVRLADFGIARIVGESPATSTGMMIGTIGFMAPEVINGGQPTAACDVYAVGITLYELLTGVQPFTGQPVAVMRGHLDTAPQRPDGLPEPLWRMIAACLAKDPAARPTAARLAAALRDPRATAGAPAVPSLALAGLAEPAELTGPAGRTGLPGGTGPWLAGPTTGTGQHTVAGIGWLTPAGPASGAAPAPGGPTWPVPGLPSTASPSRTPLAGRRRTWAVIAAAMLVCAGVAGTYLVTSGPSGSTASGSSVQPVAGATQNPSAQEAAAQSTVATSTGTAKPSASQSPSADSSAGAATQSAQPTPTAADTQAAPTTTTQSSTPATTHATASVAAPPGLTGPNLVADGDFTDSSLSAWNDLAYNVVVAGSGAEGGNAVLMNANPTAGVTQTVTGLTPGRTYILTAWVSSDTGGGTWVGAKAYDSTSGVSRAGSTSSWTEETMSFTEGAGETTAEIFCWQAVTGMGYCSNVSLQAVS